MVINSYKQNSIKINMSTKNLSNKQKLIEAQKLTLFDLLTKGHQFIKKAGFCNSTSSAIYLPKEFTNKWFMVTLVPLNENENPNSHQIKEFILMLPKEERMRLFNSLGKNIYKEEEIEVEQPYRPKNEVIPKRDKKDKIIKIITKNEPRKETNGF